MKRVAALPGDDVEWRCKQLIINSEAAFCAPLPSDQIRDLLIEEGDRHRFYREAIFGGSRVVMVLHAEPGCRDIREDLLAWLRPETGTCQQYQAVAAVADAARAEAVCRCAQYGACSTCPNLIVPPGKYRMVGGYRGNSSDARVVSFVDRRRIMAVPTPLPSRQTRATYRPRFERFITVLP